MSTGLAVFSAAQCSILAMQAVMVVRLRLVRLDTSDTALSGLAQPPGDAGAPALAS